MERTLPSRIAASKSPEKEEFQKQLEDAKQQAAKSQNDALHYCRLAMKLIDKDTELAEVNLIRYWLCYLLFNEGEYYDSIVIGVRDRGPGIAPAQLGRIFEPFERGAAGSTGLGLSIARGFAQANGGRVEVDSRAGEGSTFSLVLPRADVPAQVRA